jgi:hypothetical protein
MQLFQLVISYGGQLSFPSGKGETGERVVICIPDFDFYSKSGV